MSLFRPSLQLALFVLLAALLHGAVVEVPPAGASDPPLDTAGSDSPIPLVEIDLTAPGSMTRLGGLDLDFVQVRPGFRARFLGWPGSEEKVTRAGLPHYRVSEDYGGDLARGRKRDPRFTRPESQGAFPTAGPWNVPPFGQGSLAGFWTTDEVFALLDSLASTDSLGLVSEVDTIGNSVQGRPILALLITDHSQPLGTRPEVLITALHHAREPTGMHAGLYFLLQLLDQYGIDPELTYLLEEREIWFVPVVNPDGYVRNENTFFGSGSFGFWRKNLANNDGNPNVGTNDGVDLNRNYGYQWGYDDNGSSGEISSPTYRGPTAFSEPETQAIRDFCIAHDFKTANNYHAYWETCLYPWGYINLATPDLSAFVNLADAMMEETHYSYGYGSQVLYAVNGEANDWMYGEQLAKPKTLAFTSEVGNHNDGFWPSRTRIIPLALENYRSNLILAYGAGIFLQTDSLTVDNGGGIIRPGEVAFATHYLRSDGILGSTTGGVTVTMTSEDPQLTVLRDQITFPDLGPGMGAWPDPGEQFMFQADPGIPNGTLIELPLFITDGGAYVGTDTLRIRVGDPIEVFSDTFDGGCGNWTLEGSWACESSILTDSPGGNYNPGANYSAILDQPLDLSLASTAVLRIRTQWDIEVGYDFGLVEVSTDSEATWTAVPGDFTRPGHGVSGNYGGGTQPLGIPGHDGSKRFWVDEEFDLTAYTGENDLRLRFRIASDGGLQNDGWLIDEVTVDSYPDLVPSVAMESSPALQAPALAVSPNPFRSRARISFTLPGAGDYAISIFDISGREVKRLSEGFSNPGKITVAWNGLAGNGVPVASGTYFVRLVTKDYSTSTKLLVVR